MKKSKSSANWKKCRKYSLKPGRRFKRLCPTYLKLMRSTSQRNRSSCYKKHGHNSLLVLGSWKKSYNKPNKRQRTTPEAAGADAEDNIAR
jgi:hypothetical protein